MDFIARAGSMLDRAHRLAGILLIVIVAQAIMLVHFYGRNAELNREYDDLRDRLWVYVVPGSLAGIYSPTQDKMLLESFVTHITQSLNTYTFENLGNQYQEVKRFFSPEMLVFADSHYGEVIKTAEIDQRSSLFVPNLHTLKVEDVKSSTGKITNMKKVHVSGELKPIIAGSVVETVPVKITLEIRKVQPSSTNPFGYVLVSYRESELR